MGDWSRRRWEEIRPNLTWEILRWAIFWIVGGGGLLTFTFALIGKWLNQPITNTILAFIFVVSCVLLAIGILARKRKQVATDAGARLMTNAILIYLPIALGLAFCIWAYIIGKKVFQMSHDVELTQARITRYVLPRSLTLEQKASIAGYLSKYEPQPVVMKVVPRDEEASSYRADLQQALEKGGWPVASITYDDSVGEGLHIDMSEPMREPGQESPFDRLRLEKKPTEILREAFDQASVTVDGMGGGSGRNITTTTITISIGHRRRDKWAIPPPLRPRGQQLPEDPDKEN